MRIQTQFLIINIIGGIAVLGGYVVALINHPDTRGELWGGVPENLRFWITSFMFVSAFGYCLAMYYLIFQDGLSLDFFWGKLNANYMKGLLIIFLLTAACWIHTTFSYLETGNQVLWTFVQIELWLTGISIFLMMIGLATASGINNNFLHSSSVIGLLIISFHCLALDAMLWISRFPIKH
ncbi:MAG: hypothetical protein VYA83_05305 [Candidatus Neomarinimicrobiota bacterium]|jgi:hypothetical protein|nr:hypothetical protein [Candidatus Neomarinimicrobiota bacterium]MDP6879054.1 hypothetical protein [Candidatus Neomarinimicrobiota bacterium]MEC7871467.1 hypothetical protein [Candidatus Neomarinimicrobiota bacterium]MEC9437679.1 hypothetical protein [Candidatus Neomarinimicrobiota bacterium]|tara:strand:+ start:1884 stop:2423 length:540 start_codon:yes stop_codon:yes gene_type:complete